MRSFRNTLFPEPVVPAMSRCEDAARSKTNGLPITLTPAAIGSSKSLFLKTSDSKTSRNPTVGDSFQFFTAMPMVYMSLPVSMISTGDASHSSSSLLIVRNCLMLTPVPGITSYMAARGVMRQSLIVASTL